MLRQYVEADAEQLAEVIPRNMTHLERFMEWIKFEPQTVSQRREYIAETKKKFDAGEDYTLGIFDRSGELIGGTGFHVRGGTSQLAIGYWIDAGHEGQGLVTEAAGALTLVAIEGVGSDQVTITHAPNNTRSAAVPRRLGYALADSSAETCFDSETMEQAVEWIATAETVASEPLASWHRPRAFDAAGGELEWPA